MNFLSEIFSTYSERKVFLWKRKQTKKEVKVVSEEK